uniref:Uncharacterized protein n=1 Tax=Arion vulgaris TaxID=1028688 RepID=A0A0B7BDQ3_9EUPU
MTQYMKSEKRAEFIGNARMVFLESLSIHSLTQCFPSTGIESQVNVSLSFI